MDSSYWYEPFTSTGYRFMRVSRATGAETGRVAAVRGGSIERNDSTRIKESAEVDMVGEYRFGPDLLRVYAEFGWMDGTKADVCLGTFLPVSPSRSIRRGHSKASLKLYGRLQELLDDKFAQPVSVEPGSNAVAVARGVCEAAGLEVVADESSYTTTLARAYGVGATSERAKAGDSTIGDTKLDMVNDLLDLAGFRAAFTDPYGRVVLQKYVDADEKPVSWEFEEGPKAKFEVSMEEMRDYTDTPNHAVVVYSSTGADPGKETVVGEAYDTDPESDLSTVSRGRVITSSYSYTELPPGDTAQERQAYANARAATLLRTAQAVVKRLTFTHTYCPLKVNDVARVDYGTAGVSGRYQVRKQSIRLEAGCPVECEARAFKRRTA